MLRYQRLLFQNFSKRLKNGPELDSFLKNEIQLLPQSAKTYFKHVLYAKDFKFDEENYQKLLDEYRRLKDNGLAFLSIKEAQNARPFVLEETPATGDIFKSACVESEFWEYVRGLEEDARLYHQCAEELHRLHVDQIGDGAVVADVLDVL